MSLPVPIPESSKEKHARYPEYKDSEIEWLGEIPAHWETKKLKSIGWIRAGAGFPDAEQGLVNEGLPFYKVSDMNLDGNEILMKSHNNSVSKETAKRLGATIFPSDTIIFPKVGIALLTNKRRILHCQACLDNNTMGFYVRVGSVKFMYYRLLTLDFGRLANPGAVPSMNESQVNNLYINIPPIEEQQVIADYLDQETTKIDQLVEKKKRLIELLEEQRTAIITHAVTKGLNPDVEIKDSGVEWLGEIPEHWDLKTVKRIFKVFNGSTPKSSEPSFWG
jgi:type I restriction enzyme S subunit